MNLKELLDFLDLENPEEFQYFENLADLFECDEEISHAVLYELFNKTNMTVLSELFGNYFDELLENIPDDSIDLYTLVNMIKTAILGMSAAIVEDHDLVLLVDELYRFRNWYSFDSIAVCKNRSTGAEQDMSLRDALVLFRLEKLNEGKYTYDFDGCLDYPMEEYMMSFTDIVAAEALEEETEKDELADGYVYDDEFVDSID